MKINIIEAVPAAGKTAAILNHVAKSGEKSIISSISRQLNRQSYDYYMSIGGKGSTIIDMDNKNENSSVTKTLESALVDEPQVVFITHATLLQFEKFDLFKGYNLYIDEVPDMVSLKLMKFTHNAYKVLQYCKEIDKKVNTTYNLVLNEDMRKELTEVATDGFYKNDEIAEKLLPVYRSLLHGFPIKYRQDEEGISQVFFIEDLTNQDWTVFNQVTIACANFYQTFTGYVLKHWNGWSFTQSPLYKDLMFTKYPNTKRVQINVVVDQNWSRYVADKRQGDNTVYQIAQDKIESMFDGGSYLYTTNNYRSRMNGHQIQYNPHGLNMYSSSTNVVAMFSYNPQPWQIPILKELATMQNLDENELIDAFIVSKYLEPIFQLCTRGDIRNANSNKPIQMVVPDLRAAMYLKQNYLPEAFISLVDAIKVSEEVSAPKNYNWTTRGISSVLEMNVKERSAFYYFCNKSGRKANTMNPTDPKDLLLAKNWLTEYRNKKSK